MYIAVSGRHKERQKQLPKQDSLQHNREGCQSQAERSDRGVSVIDEKDTNVFVEPTVYSYSPVSVYSNSTTGSPCLALLYLCVPRPHIPILAITVNEVRVRAQDGGNETAKV